MLFIRKITVATLLEANNFLHMFVAPWRGESEGKGPCSQIKLMGWGAKYHLCSFQQQKNYYDKDNYLIENDQQTDLLSPDFLTSS